MYRNFSNPIIRHLLLAVHGRTAFELVLMLSLVVSSVRALISANTPTAVLLRELTQGQIWLYYSSIIVAAVTVLVSLFTSSQLGLKVERAGLTFMAGLLMSYGIAIFAVIPARETGIGSALILSMGLACVARIVQIQFDLKAASVVAAELRQLRSVAKDDEK